MFKILKLTILIISLTTCILCAQNESPVINEFVPTKAFPGDKIIIKGNNFSEIDNTVFFGKIKATPKALSANELEVTVPSEAKVCDVFVESKGQRSNEMKFYVLPYVELKLAANKIEIDKKTKGIITVYGSEKPWQLQVTNKYYEIVELEGGKEIIITTSGGEENTAEINITAKKKGNFNINFKVLQGDPEAEKKYREKSKNDKPQNTKSEEIKYDKIEVKTENAEVKNKPENEPENRQENKSEKKQEIKSEKKIESGNKIPIPTETFHKSNNDF